MYVGGRKLSSDEQDTRLGRQYRKVLEMHEAGDIDDHPLDITPREWPSIMRAGKDAASPEIEKGDHPEFGDEAGSEGENAPTRNPGNPSTPGGNRGKMSADAALRSHRGMARLIPGLDRLRR